MIKRGIIFFILVMIIIFSCAETNTNRQGNARKRPILGNGTVLTSYGTMLRGVRWSLDASGKLPDRKSVSEIKDFGMNSLHVYVERHDSGVPAGSYVRQMDTIAEWCGEDGLYCVIVIGGGSHDGQFDLDFARTFWNTYAPRYKDMPWVVYEIHNEPDPEWNAPYEKETLEMNQEMYDIIRKHAPDTMVLLLTVSAGSAAGDVLFDINQLDVDWSNAAVAFHGFGRSTTDMITPLKEAGVHLICTELGICSPFSDEQVHPLQIRLCEELEVSWLSFMEIQKGFLDSWRFKEELDKRGVGWTPDSGGWPEGPAEYTPPDNLALGKKITVSSVENYMGTGELLQGEYAVDGLDYTRWGSAFADNQYIIVDFENIVSFDLITIQWAGQWAVDYEVLVSDDMKNWHTIFSENGYQGPGQPVYMRQRLKVDGEGRYLKLFLKKRRMQWGFSLYEMEVFDTSAD